MLDHVINECAHRSGKSASFAEYDMQSNVGGAPRWQESYQAPLRERATHLFHRQEGDSHARAGGFDEDIEVAGRKDRVKGYLHLLAVRPQQLPGPRTRLFVEAQEGQVLNIARLVEAFMINDQSRLCDEDEVAREQSPHGQ